MRTHSTVGLPSGCNTDRFVWLLDMKTHEEQTGAWRLVDASLHCNTKDKQCANLLNDDDDDDDDGEKATGMM